MKKVRGRFAEEVSTNPQYRLRVVESKKHKKSNRDKQRLKKELRSYL